MRPYWTDGERTLYLGNAWDVFRELDVRALAGWDRQQASVSVVVFTDPPNEAAGDWSWSPRSISGLALGTHLLVNAGTVPEWWEIDGAPRITLWERPERTRQGYPCDVFLHWPAWDAPGDLPPYVSDLEQRLTDHPAERGMAAWTNMLAVVASESALVIDPFCGSGTTLVAARNLGIRAIGIEAEERYCAMAVERLS